MEANKNSSVASQVATVVNIPGYAIKDVLGRGGMATVYLAEQESIGRQVALKVLAPDHSDPTFSERFLSEARIISKLSHPNIITIYDAGIHQGCHYMAMEYIPGQNMQDAIDKLPRKEKIIIIKQVAQALDFAGSKGYVHRDIKPENIMLHADGRAILTDFGIAREQTNQGLTQTGKTIGTPYYMSPEQTKGLSVDHRSDVYSLGVVLFQSLAGYLPYDGPSLVAVGIKHLSDPIPSLPTGLEVFQPIINICMSKDPAHRYQTAGELLSALNKISEAELDYVNAKARASAAPRKPNTGTMLEHAVVKPVSQPQSIPRVHKPASMKPPPIDVTDTEEFKSLRRRRKFLFMVFLVIAGTAAYYDRDRLLPLWQQHAHPVIAPYLPDALSGQAPPVITSPVVSDAYTEETETDTEPETLTTTTDQANPAILDIHTGNAVQLADMYKKRLALDPNDTDAMTGLQNVRDWFQDEIRDAMTNKDVARAREQLTLLKAAFPQMTGQPRFSEIETQLVSIETFNKHVRMANVYFATNAMIKPEGANALEELLAASLIEPDSDIVRRGLNRIATFYFDKARTIENPAEGMTQVQAGLLAVQDHAGLLELKQNFASKLQDQKKLSDLVSLMNIKIKQRHFTQPTGNSLYDVSKQILAMDPGNAEALRGQRIVEEQFVLEAKAALKNEELVKARKTLEQANRYFPNSLALSRVARQVDTKIDATFPKITRVVFSDKPLATLEQQPALGKMQPGQTLYIGFGYKNFYTSSTRLDIRLTDVTGQELYSGYPTTVAGKTGNHFLTITLPESGPSDGNYGLEILMENTRIQRARLSGLH
jgi:serine/threonine protein kinase